MFIVNCSKDKQVYSQRNNQLRPGISCNVTSMVMMLSYAGYSFPKGKYSQPEDNLLDFLLTDEGVNKYYKKIDPHSYKKYINSDKDPEVSFPPNEVHTVLSEGTNLWMKSKCTVFYERRLITDLLYQLILGRASVISGVFNGLHHVVTLVGFVTQQDPNTVVSVKDIHVPYIQSIIIDDPYGDYRTSYVSTKGDNVELSWSDFVEIVKPQKETLVKRAHILI